MSALPFVCTACSCLCDDLRVEWDGVSYTRLEKACLRGSAFLYAAPQPQHRATCRIGSHEVSSPVAIAQAARRLKAARHPVIFSLDNSTLEAQAEGIRLAQALGAVLDDTSSFCHGATVEAILQGKLPACTLEEARHADTIIYWGANPYHTHPYHTHPYHTHPRHLSHFSYYPRERFRDAGWVPDVTLAAVEVRDTETTSLCRPVFRLKPGEDGQFLGEVNKAGRGGRVEGPAQEMAELLDKSRFCVIFAGLGLIYALDNSLEPFLEMVAEFSRSCRLAVIPMVGHYNTVGLNHTLFQLTGHVNRVCFNGHIKHGPAYSFLEQIREGQADLLFIIGSDPLSSLPASLTKKLEGIPLICLDPFVTATTRRADIVLGGALSGVEAGGSARRMDGQVIALRPLQEVEHPSDEAFLRLLRGEVQP